MAGFQVVYERVLLIGRCKKRIRWTDGCMQFMYKHLGGEILKPI